MLQVFAERAKQGLPPGHSLGTPRPGAEGQQVTQEAGPARHATPPAAKSLPVPSAMPPHMPMQCRALSLPITKARG